MEVNEVLSLIGGLCLFLFGMNLMGSLRSTQMRHLQMLSYKEQRTTSWRHCLPKLIKNRGIRRMPLFERYRICLLAKS